MKNSHSESTLSIDYKTLRTPRPNFSGKKDLKMSLPPKDEFDSQSFVYRNSPKLTPNEGTRHSPMSSTRSNQVFTLGNYENVDTRRSTFEMEIQKKKQETLDDIKKLEMEIQMFSMKLNDTPNASKKHSSRLKENIQFSSTHSGVINKKNHKKNCSIDMIEKRLDFSARKRKEDIYSEAKVDI